MLGIESVYEKPGVPFTIQNCFHFLTVATSKNNFYSVV